MGPGRMAMVIERFEVYLVNLDPTQGREIQKTRPCLVISPNEMNHHIGQINESTAQKVLEVLAEIFAR